MAELVSQFYFNCPDRSKTYERAHTAEISEQYLGVPIPHVVSIAGWYKFPGPQQSYTVPHSGDNKITITIPNNGYMQLNSLRLTGLLNLGYNWIGGGPDPGYDTVLPSLCRGVSSIIKRIDLTIGSRQVFMEENINVFNAYQDNFRNNPYFYNQKYLPYGMYNSEAEPYNVLGLTRKFEIYFQHYVNSFFNQAKNILLPIGALPPLTLNIYLAPASECCYTAGNYSDAQVQMFYTLSDTPALEYTQVMMPAAMNPVPAFIQFQTYNWQSQITNSKSISYQIPTKQTSLSHVVLILRDQSQIADVKLSGASKLRLGSNQLSEIRRCQFKINGATRFTQDLQNGRDLKEQLVMMYPQVLTSDWATAEGTWNGRQMVFVLNFSSDYDLKSDSGSNTSRQNSYATAEIQIGDGGAFSSTVQIWCYVVYHAQLRMTESGEAFVDS